MPVAPFRGFAVRDGWRADPTVLERLVGSIDTLTVQLEPFAAYQGWDDLAGLPRASPTEFLFGVVGVRAEAHRGVGEGMGDVGYGL